MNMKHNYLLPKRNELKYDKDAVRIPEHLFNKGSSDDEDLTFEEMESYCQNNVKDKDEEVKYRTVKWNDIKSWEYSYYSKMDQQTIITLSITTGNEIISVTVKSILKMKWYFKKYAKEKQIINTSNIMEIVGIFFSVVIILGFVSYIVW